MTESIQNRLSLLWEKRNLGKVEEATNLFLDWTAELEIEKEMSIRDRKLQLLKQGFDKENALLFLLFEVSLLRNRTDVLGAERLLALIEEEFSDLPPRHQFQLAFQKGLNAFVQSRYSQAFDLFFDAQRRAVNPHQTVNAIYNRTLSMEYLGLDYQDTLQSLKTHFASLSAEWQGILKSKIAPLEALNAFRRADLKELKELLDSAPAEEYLDYFLSWTCRLPWLEFSKSPPVYERFLKQYAANGSQWLRSYRLRTLQELEIAADKRVDIPLREQIERFYLWVWSWLETPSLSSIERVLSLKRDFHIASNQAVSEQEFLLWENANRWLGLFANLNDKDVRKTLTLSHARGGVSLFLDYERLLLDLLVAMRDSDQRWIKDTSRTLLAHPAHSLSGFLLPELTNAILEKTEAAPRLTTLSRSLEDLLPKTEEKLKSGIIVNGLEKTLRIIEGGKIKKQFHTHPFVSLLLLYRTRQSCSKQEVLWACFSLPKYDAYVHDSKLANLISQANTAFKGKVHFAIRREQIVGEWQRKEATVFESTSDHSSSLLLSVKDSLELLEIAKSPSKEDSAVSQKVKNFVQVWRRREEYEVLLGVSKATATRKLASWAEDGLLEKKGQGKNCLYRMLPELEGKLKEERIS